MEEERHGALLRAERAGFTLVELLAVISIIGVLSVLGYAGLQNAQAKAQETECVSHLRRLSQGIMQYAQDQGTFPKTSHSGGSWAMAIAPYIDEPSLSQGSDYRTQKTFVCPANKLKSPDGRMAMSYGMNVFFEVTSARRYTPSGMPIMSRDSYVGSPATWHMPVNVSHPSRTVLLAENANAAPSADHFMAHQWTSDIAPRNALDTKRHGERSNFAFVDGHVESLPVEMTFDTSKSLNLWNPSLAGNN